MVQINRGGSICPVWICVLDLSSGAPSPMLEMPPIDYCLGPLSHVYITHVIVMWATAKKQNTQK